jgi:SAM-dependent methyltransferase
MSFNRADFYDAELRRHNQRFRSALRIGPGDRVLDVGCGAGQSTREAARAAPEGSVLGVDVSEEMLEVARRRAAEAGLGNIAFEQGDAQSFPFPAGRFDLCISRFGTMFFADPRAAFANIARAMRPGGGLALMVWQGRDDNEWATAIQDALAPERIAAPSAPPAFSLGDRTVTTDLLTAAGFASIAFTDVNEPVFYGPTVEAAYAAIVELFLPKGQGAGAPKEATVQRLRALLETHLSEDGVHFASRAWIVTAHAVD